MRRQDQFHSFAGMCAALLFSGCFLFSDSDDNGNRGPACSVATDCEEGLRCGAGVCIEPGAAGLAGACWANPDCEEGLYCSKQGLCAPAGSGGVGTPCGTGAECAADLYCEVFGLSGTCQSAGTGDVGSTCTEAAGCLGGLVCGPASTCQHPLEAYPPFEGVDCAPDEAPFRAFFEVPRPSAPLEDFYRLPFPSDIRDNGDGTLDLSDFPRPGPGALGFDLVGLYADALAADFNGFSSIAPVSFRFSSPVSFSTLSPATVHYIDVTPGAPELGDDRFRSWKYASSRSRYNCQHFFTMQNTESSPLLPGHTYAAYVTTGISDENGVAPVQDADLTTMLAAATPADADLVAAHATFQPFRDYIAGEASLDAASVAAATVFTVGDAPARTRAVMEAAIASPAPVLTDLTLCDGATTSPCEDATGRGACSPVNANFHEIHGRFSLPVFQQGTAPYELPEDGGAVADPPTVQRTEAVCFALTVPTTAAPVGGFPTVVYAHGTGGSFRGVVANGGAEALATASTPTAVFSYDGVVHGERRGASTQQSDALMFNIVNPAAARDNNLQGAVDVAQALRVTALAPFAVAGIAGNVDLDATRTYYFGHSQGSNVGIPAIATQDGTLAAIFSGAGSYLIKAILSKTSPVDAKLGLEFLIGEELTEHHPVMVIWQNYFDPVETLNFTPLLVQRPIAGLASKHIFMTWGPGDTFSPVPTLNATGLSAGLPAAEPVIEAVQGQATVARPVSLNLAGGDGQNRTAAMFQYTADGFDGHFVAARNPSAVADWLAFLMTLIETGTPTVE